MGGCIHDVGDFTCFVPPCVAMSVPLLSMLRRLDYRNPMTNNTFVNHPPEVPVPADNRPLIAPIYQSVKFSFDDAAETSRYLRGEREGFYYSRSSNPTLRQL